MRYNGLRYVTLTYSSYLLTITYNYLLVTYSKTLVAYTQLHTINVN